MKRYGTRAEVWHGTARMTQGRLTKSNFIMNKHGRIVSKIKSKKTSKEKKTNPLLKVGYQQPKGSNTFGKLVHSIDTGNKNGIRTESKNKNKKKSWSLLNLFT